MVNPLNTPEAQQLFMSVASETVMALHNKVRRLEAENKRLTKRVDSLLDYVAELEQKNA